MYCRHFKPLKLLWYCKVPTFFIWVFYFQLDCKCLEEDTYLLYFLFTSFCWDLSSSTWFNILWTVNKCIFLDLRSIIVDVKQLLYKILCDTQSKFVYYRVMGISSHFTQASPCDHKIYFYWASCQRVNLVCDLTCHEPSFINYMKIQ